MITHAAIIRHVLETLKFRRYLEIGVQGGVTFNQVEADEKIGVDPNFQCDPATLKGTALSQTSDSFFDENPGRIFDLIFIDGLHSFEQSLRDFTRSISRIAPNGLILVDDCYPSDFYASMRDANACNLAKEAENWPDRNWQGDVYKTALFINDFMDQFSYAYIAGTQGVIAVWHAPRPVRPFFHTMRDIAECDYYTFRHLIAPRIRQLTIEEIVETMQAGGASLPGDAG